MNMHNEFNELYKEIIRLVKGHLSVKDDDRMISFKHNLKNVIINLSKVYFEQILEIWKD